MPTKYDVNFTDRKYESDAVKAKINDKMTDRVTAHNFNQFLIDELNKNDELSKELRELATVQMYSCYDSFLTDRQKTAVVETVQAANQTIDHKRRTSLIAGLTVLNLFI